MRVPTSTGFISSEDANKFISLGKAADQDVVQAKRTRKNGEFVESAEEAISRVAKENPGKLVILAPADVDVKEPAKETEPAVAPPKTNSIPDFAPPRDEEKGVVINIMKIVDTLIPVTNSFKGKELFVPHVTAKRALVYWMLDQKWHIGPFNDIESFHSAFHDLCMRYYDAFAQRTIEPSSDFNPLVPGVRHTKMSDIGFDLTKLYNMRLREASTVAVYNAMRRIANGEETPDHTKKDMAAVLPAFSAELISLFNSYYEDQLITVQQAYEFAKEFTDKSIALKRPGELDEELRFVRAIGPPKNWNIGMHMMQDNVFINRAMTRVHLGFLKQVVAISSAHADELYINLVRKLQLVDFAHSEANEIPKLLTNASGANLARQLILLLTAPTEVYGTVFEHPAPFGAQPTMSEFIELLMFKLILPSHCLSDQSRVDIDNRICQCFYEFFRVQNNNHLFDPDAARHTAGRNQLTEMLNRRVFALTPEAIAFLKTDNRLPGSGWSTTADYQTGVLPATLAQAMHIDQLASTPFTSAYNTTPHMKTDPGAQFLLFGRLIDALSNLRLKNERAGRAIITSLNVVAAAAEQFSRMNGFMVRTLKALTLLGLFKPKTPADVIDESRRSQVLLKGSPLAMILLINWEDSGMTSVSGFDIANYTRGIAHYWQHMANMWWLIDRRFPGKRYTKTWRLMQLQKMMGRYDLGFNDEFFKATLPDVESYFAVMPRLTDVDPMFAMIHERIEAFIRGSPELHGYAESFYYGVTEKKNQLYERIITPLEPDTELKVSVEDLAQMTAEGRMTRFFESALAERHSIQVMHPIRIRMVETRNRRPQAPPIAPDVYGPTFKVNELEVQFAFFDDFIDNVSDRNWGVREAEWGVMRYPFIEKDENFASEMVRQITVPRQGTKIMGGFEFYIRHSYI
jgi:hypothetical protein